MLIAQISDLHVAPAESKAGQLMKTEAFTRAAVAHLNALDRAPDVVLASGDLVDAGSREEYELLAELLEPLEAPLYLAAGNHDDREVLREVFLRQGHGYLPESGFLQYAVDLGDLRLVVLDTLVPGQPFGRLCKERLDWLDATLEQDRKPTLLMQHHPPFRTGIVHMDGMGLEGIAAQEAIIGRHPHIERVVCGHLHRTISRRFAGTVASTAPSTAHALELDLNEHGRLAVVAEPPGCALHLWQDSGLVTHLSYIGDYGRAHVICD